jgi:hypothetical protein
MDSHRLPAALQDRLGQEASAGLIELLTDARKEWTAEVIGTVGDGFERRLTEETSKLRVDMAALRSDLRQEMGALRGDLRQEMAALRGDLRQEMGALCSNLRQETGALYSDLRQETTEGFASLRQALADQRFEILKWAFLFWVGQFFAVAGLVAVLIRFLRPGG